MFSVYSKIRFFLFILFILRMEQCIGFSSISRSNLLMLIISRMCLF